MGILQVSKWINQKNLGVPYQSLQEAILGHAARAVMIAANAELVAAWREFAGLNAGAELDAAYNELDDAAADELDAGADELDVQAGFSVMAELAAQNELDAQNARDAAAVNAAQIARNIIAQGDLHAQNARTAQEALDIFNQAAMDARAVLDDFARAQADLNPPQLNPHADLNDLVPPQADLNDLNVTMNNFQVMIFDVNSILYMSIKNNRDVTIEWLQELCQSYIRNIQATNLILNGAPIKFIFVFDYETHEFKWRT
jgi:hypothetical protein